MNKIFVFFAALLSTLIFSCSKNQNEALQPQAGSPQNGTQQTTAVPHFDETNSKQIDWSQMPADLRNAIPLETTKELKPQDSAKNATAKGSGLLYSYYRYAMGPWGGSGGSSFYIMPPSGSKLYAMAIRAGGLVDRITVWYRLANGTIYMGGDRGGNGGTYYLQFFSTDEYISYVNGRSGAYLDRLGIYTNKKSFSYGGWGGLPFSASVPAGYQVLGFFGGSGGYVDRLGFYVYSL